MNNNVDCREDELIEPKSYGFHPFVFSSGGKDLIKYGPIELLWGGGGSVHFFGRQDIDDRKAITNYTIELAPTLWKDIKDVNIRDPRIRWYRYNEYRPREDIPIDQLWIKK